MSSGNFLDKLLDSVEVEWIALGKVTSVLRGKRLTKSQLSPGEKFPVYHGGLEPLGCYKEGNRAAGTVMVINVGASAGTVGYSAVEFWSSDGCFCLEHSSILNNRYLYFALIGHQNLLRSKVRVAGIPTLDAIVVEKLEIPIPCRDNPVKSLEIQREIVRILDNFTDLTAELTAELTARMKQYDHYRDLLLSFEDGKMKWKTLGEVVNTIKTGKLNANAMVEDGAYPFFTCDAKPFKIDTYAFDTEAIIVSGNGSQIGHINYYKGKFNAYQRTYVLSDCSNVISMQFLLTYLKAYLRVYIMQHSKKGSVPYITMPMLENFPIPIPSPEEQAHIVAILDKFDVLTNSINEGLPREIELRQKQYEHYRDLLLSFANPEAIEA